MPRRHLTGHLTPSRRLRSILLLRHTVLAICAAAAPLARQRAAAAAAASGARCPACRRCTIPPACCPTGTASLPTIPAAATSPPAAAAATAPTAAAATAAAVRRAGMAAAGGCATARLQAVPAGAHAVLPYLTKQSYNHVPPYCVTDAGMLRSRQGTSLEGLCTTVSHSKCGCCEHFPSRSTLQVPRSRRSTVSLEQVLPDVVRVVPSPLPAVHDGRPEAGQARCPCMSIEQVPNMCSRRGPFPFPNLPFQPLPHPQCITDAQKQAKYAISALSFEDIPTAVKNLTEALRQLTDPSAAAQHKGR